MTRPARPLTDEQRRLVEDNLPLAFWLAAKLLRQPFYRYSFRFPEDAHQAALLGLCFAAKSYDPSRGTTFATYAYTSIRRRIDECAESEADLVHVPRCSHRLAADRLAARKALKVQSLPVGRSGGDLLPAPREDDPAEHEALYLALARLRPCDRELLADRFGLGQPARSLAEIAERMGTTKQAVHGRQRQALAELRELLADAND